jgi:hypothetical protein
VLIAAAERVHVVACADTDRVGRVMTVVRADADRPGASCLGGRRRLSGAVHSMRRLVAAGAVCWKNRRLSVHLLFMHPVAEQVRLGRFELWERIHE